LQGDPHDAGIWRRESTQRSLRKGLHYVPDESDAVADLIIRAGSLPADVRGRLTSIAQGKTAGAPHARAILAARSARR
jgi:hypothetical protein